MYMHHRSMNMPKTICYDDLWLIGFGRNRTMLSAKHEIYLPEWIVYLIEWITRGFRWDWALVNDGWWTGTREPGGSGATPPPPHTHAPTWKLRGRRPPNFGLWMLFIFIFACFCAWTRAIQKNSEPNPEDFLFWVGVCYYFCLFLRMNSGHPKK